MAKRDAGKSSGGKERSAIVPDSSQSAGGREDGGSFQRRLPSPLVRISDIQPSDIRVSVIGTVIDRADDGIVLDDGTGRIDVTLEGSGKEVPERVRVFGRAVPMEGGFQLQGEIIQDMTGLDMELLKKVGSL